MSSQNLLSPVSRILRSSKLLLLVLLSVIQIFVSGAIRPVVAAATRVHVFVGLLGGGDYLNNEYNAIAANFNSQHTDVKLTFDFHFYSNNYSSQAQAELTRELAGKQPPDIIGPIGLAGVNLLPASTWVDLAPLIANDPLNADDFSEQSTNYFKSPDGKVFALGEGVYPSLLFVNEGAFKAADVPLPPKTLGATYVDKDGTSKAWDWDTLAQVAQQVTVDKAGKHPGEKGFSQNAISMYGFSDMWELFRDMASSFGPQDAGLASDGKTATFNQTAYQTAIQWYQDGIFKNHFIPAGFQQNQLVSKGSPFESGKIAMFYSHTWYLSSANSEKFDWGVYAPPAVSGTDGKTVISPLHVDGFGIADKSLNKEAAWQVLKWLVSDPDTAAHLCALWNCIPNAVSARGNWLSTRGSQWNVLPAGRTKFLNDLIAHGDSPLNESYVPNYKRTTDTLATFWTSVQSAPIAKVDVRLAALNKQIQALYDSALKAKK